MRKTIALVILGLACGELVRAAAPPAAPLSTFVDNEYGYSIRVPRLGPPKPGTTVTRLAVFAPPEEAFSSNINVLIQHVATSRAAYRQVSLDQHKALGYKINSERNSTVGGREALFLDAEGEQQGRQLRFLSLAVFETDRVILTTCTAPTASFAKYEAAFRASLDSYKPIVKRP